MSTPQSNTRKEGSNRRNKKRFRKRQKNDITKEERPTRRDNDRNFEEITKENEVFENNAHELRDIMKVEHVPALCGISFKEGEKAEAPFPLNWYPDELAWQHTAPKLAIKKHPHFKEFHQWLVSETEAGHISRQEAVSMIPPLLLDLKPHHYVLDMCAAPGSKTAQLIEALHVNIAQSNDVPTGVIIANDLDQKRSHMLVRQVKRLQSPCVLITNHDAGQFPSIILDRGDRETKKKQLSFDRILADVPCSGDGTIRKNTVIWHKWKIGDALGLHKTQVKILFRGAQILKDHGRIVYSTCSLNPIENEAVVAEVLLRANGNLHLVDVSNELPEFKRLPGLLTWKVMDKEQQWIEKWEDLPPNKQRHYAKSLWPPANSNEMNLERCWRIYPHLQNTGGFFVAVFEKTGPIKDNTGNNVASQDTISKMDVSEKDDKIAELPSTITEPLLSDDEIAELPSVITEPLLSDGEIAELPSVITEPLVSDDENSDTAETISVDRNANSDNKGKQIKEKTHGISYEEPFIFLDSEHHEVKSISEFYGLSRDFPVNQFLVRSSNNEHNVIYFVNDSIQYILRAQDSKRLRVVNTGIKAFTRTNSNVNVRCPFRFHQDGLFIIAPFIQDTRIVYVGVEAVQKLMEETAPLISNFSPSVISRLNDLDEGGILFSLDPSKSSNNNIQFPIILPVWKARCSLNLLYKKDAIRGLQKRLDRAIKISEN
ncbi:9791_t:CDS:10 [Ambispora gerdemannii]|uniref:9791_t:CDS:1 n=1 Tax=Ambispora gerdemannii TaxID=144530 RepID=A0A9N9C7A7_9GLOM|nr:9791_t:CDS:10 [Ambispora gerdemannii]